MTTETRAETLMVSGDIDLYVAADFRHAGEKHVLEHDNPVIDLLSVPFLDSAGLAALLSITRVARTHERLLRVRATGNPRRVLRITGVDRMVKVED
ncbi:MAG: STAS domain-containing protein [Fibrella sp.]|nr:STAS domain-containing protein [Armatimonadota bacterium]